MSDMHKTKSEIVVLQTIPSHQGLMKVNRWLMAVVFFLMTIIVVAGFFLSPADDVIRYKREDYAAGMNPVLSAEVNSLKGQFVGLVSGSIESKLRTLEESIRLGAASTALGTIEDLKNDVKVLRSYSEPVKQKDVAIANEQLIQEMSELKRLVYVTLASCGLMLAAVAGIWIKNRYRLPYKEAIIRYLGKK